MAYNKKHYTQNRVKIQQRQSVYGKRVRKELRMSIFNILGLKCVKCGFDDLRALQIDHINGGGRKERNTPNMSSINYFKGILSKIIEGSNNYQILCANCNWIKRSENNEQPYFNK